MEQILTIIAAIIGLAIGAFIVRQVSGTAWGKRMYSAGEAWHDDEVNRRHADGVDHWKNYEKEMIKQDMCYGNMGLGLGPQKHDHE